LVGTAQLRPSFADQVVEDMWLPITSSEKSGEIMGELRIQCTFKNTVDIFNLRKDKA